jgi:hypothetical protein
VPRGLATLIQRDSERSGIRSPSHTSNSWPATATYRLPPRTRRGEDRGFTAQLPPPLALPRSMSLLPAHGKEPHVILRRTGRLSESLQLGPKIRLLSRPAALSVQQRGMASLVPSVRFRPLAGSAGCCPNRLATSPGRHSTCHSGCRVRRYPGLRSVAASWSRPSGFCTRPTSAARIAGTAPPDRGPGPFRAQPDQPAEPGEYLVGAEHLLQHPDDIGSHRLPPTSTRAGRAR